MHGLHRIRTGEDEILIAALQGRPSEILGRQLHLLQRGAGGAVEHQHGPLRAMEPFEETDAGRARLGGLLWRRLGARGGGDSH